jgi:hypothetical protein
MANFADLSHESPMPQKEAQEEAASRLQGFEGAEGEKAMTPERKTELQAEFQHWVERAEIFRYPIGKFLSSTKEGYTYERWQTECMFRAFCAGKGEAL